MKTFRLIGMALVAVLLSVNFVACSDDDDEEGGGGGGSTAGKRLTSMMDNDDHDAGYYKFSYDKNNRLSQVVYNENDYQEDSYYTWESNTIVAKEYDDDGFKNQFTYTLSDNKVTSWKEEWYYSGRVDYTYRYSCTYNSDGRITKVVETYEDGDTYTYAITWDGNKITQMTKDEGGDYATTYTYTYGNAGNKGWAPLTSGNWVWHIFENHPLFFAHPELVGLNDWALPSRQDEAGSEYFDTFNYILNDEGYVSKQVITDEDGDTDSYTYIWE